MYRYKFNSIHAIYHNLLTRKHTLLNYRKIWIKFWNPEFESAIEGTIWKTDSNAEKCVFFWEIWERIWKKLFTSTVFSQVHTHYQQKKRTLFHENSFVHPFLHSNQMTKKESNITQSILRTEFSEVKPLLRFSILIAKSNTLGTSMQREFSVLAKDWHIFGRARKVSGTQGKNPKSGFQNLNPDFDVMLLLLSPLSLIFLHQHRAVRQLKSNTAQQLEVETKKMEERIRALKEQMFKEKEERE